MATRNFQRSNIEGGGRAATIFWTGLLAAPDLDVGQGYGDWTAGEMAAYYSDKSAQVVGTFGAGGALIIEGSNAATPGATDWVTLHDPQGNLLSFTAADIEVVLENVRHVRPRVTGGDGTTNLSVYILGRMAFK